MGQMRVHRTGPWVKSSCPFYWVQFNSRIGHGLGQGKMAEMNRLKKFSKAKKNRANHADLHGCGGDYRTRICDLLRMNICQVKK